MVKILSHCWSPTDHFWTLPCCFPKIFPWRWLYKLSAIYNTTDETHVMDTEGVAFFFWGIQLLSLLHFFTLGITYPLWVNIVLEQWNHTILDLKESLRKTQLNLERKNCLLPQQTGQKHQRSYCNRFIFCSERPRTHFYSKLEISKSRHVSWVVKSISDIALEDVNAPLSGS